MLSAPVQLPGTPITGLCHLEMVAKLFKLSFIHRGLFGKTLIARPDAAAELLLQEEVVSVPGLTGRRGDHKAAQPARPEPRQHPAL